jgi:eight-cysteine-cluster-containing protein
MIFGGVVRCAPQRRIASACGGRCDDVHAVGGYFAPRGVSMWLWMVLGCGSPALSTPDVAPDLAHERAPHVAPAVPEPSLITGEQAYSRWHDRLELPEADGECTTNADCAVAGCGGEVCVSGARVAEVVTTCEVLPVFQVLDHCACQRARCAWQIKGSPALTPIRVPAAAPSEEVR